MNKNFYWLKIHSKAISIIVSIVALISSIGVFYIEFIVDNQYREVELKATQKKLVDQAYDKLGGGQGVKSISNIRLMTAPEEDLVLALRLTDEALVLRTGTNYLYFVRGIIFYAGNDIKNSLEAFNKAAELAVTEEEKVNALIGIANLTTKAKIPEHTVILYQDIIEKYPDAKETWQARMNLASAYSGMLDFDMAAKTLQPVADRYPLNCRVKTELGIIYSRLENVPSAIENLEAAVILCPDSQVARMNLGHQYMKQEEYELARIEYDESAKLDAAYGGSFVSLGKAYIGMNKLKLAEETLEKSIDLDPKSSTARYFLAYVYYLQNYYKTALPIALDAEKVRNQFEEDPVQLLDLYILIAAIYNHVHRYADARTFAKKALDIDSNSLDAKKQFNFAGSNISAGTPVEANGEAKLRK